LTVAWPEAWLWGTKQKNSRHEHLEFLVSLEHHFSHSRFWRKKL
jgi:hypothetical protein